MMNDGDDGAEEEEALWWWSLPRGSERRLYGNMAANYVAKLTVIIEFLVCFTSNKKQAAGQINHSRLLPTYCACNVFSTVSSNKQQATTTKRGSPADELLY